MATENITNGSNIESKEKSSFSEQIKNLKYAVIIALGMTPSLVGAQTTTSADTTKAQTEIVQQGEDPVKDLMKKFNVTSVEKIEDLELKDMIAMRDQMLIILRDHSELDSNPELVKIRKELKFNIEGLAPTGFDLASRKAAPSGSESKSDEEKQRIEEKQKKLAKLTEENKTKKEEGKDLDKQIKELTNKVEATQKVAQSLAKKE